jgi:hypothetical protein
MGMKPFISVGVVALVVSNLLPTAFGVEGAGNGGFVVEMSPIVKEEFRKAREDLRTELITSRKKVSELDALRVKIVAQTQKNAIYEEAWVDHLRKYDILLGARYVNDKGEYQAQMELTDHDTGNINKLFDEYLHGRPFQGRVTVSMARKTLEGGQEKLRDMVKIHKEPTESNNMDLQIIAQQKDDSQKQIAKVLMLAQQLGFDLNRDTAVAEAPRTAPTSVTRAPASAPASDKKPQ